MAYQELGGFKKSSSDDRPGPGICGSKYVEDAKAARSVRVWDRVPMKNKTEGEIRSPTGTTKRAHTFVWALFVVPTGLEPVTL